MEPCYWTCIAVGTEAVNKHMETPTTWFLYIYIYIYIINNLGNPTQLPTLWANIFQ
jgi:hypothetical protein